MTPSRRSPASLALFLYPEQPLSNPFRVILGSSSNLLKLVIELARVSWISNDEHILAEVVHLNHSSATKRRMLTARHLRLVLSTTAHARPSVSFSSSGFYGRRGFSSTRCAYFSISYKFLPNRHHIYLLVIVSLILPATMADSFKKIAVANPVVELDGDEMTRIIWKKIREEVSRFFHSPLNAG